MSRFNAWDRVTLADGTDAMVAPVQPTRVVSHPVLGRLVVPTGELAVIVPHKDPRMLARGLRQITRVAPDRVTFVEAAKDAGLVCGHWEPTIVGPEGAWVEMEHVLPGAAVSAEKTFAQPGAHLKTFCRAPATNHNANHTQYRCAAHARHDWGELPMPGVPVCVGTRMVPRTVVVEVPGARGLNEDVEGDDGLASVETTVMAPAPCPREATHGTFCSDCAGGDA